MIWESLDTFFLSKNCIFFSQTCEGALPPKNEMDHKKRMTEKMLMNDNFREPTSTEFIH